MIWIIIGVITLSIIGFSVHIRFRDKDETDEEWDQDDDYFDE